MRFRRGEYKEAVDHLIRALKLNPDFAAARDCLEKAKEKAGMIR
ncbi:MAG: tetratricopeptide repeat protein [Candidatus Euphemobacter frigidus]|nr:tetratricopeptide repeat protein [Candidatus Euphemobacter frigidus]MDP8275572.1 tetratricopeptide repeat protein [Candidatus Euphemobacter frigidus]